MNKSYREGEIAVVRAVYPLVSFEDCYTSADFISDSKTFFIELSNPLHVVQNELLEVINFSDKDMVLRIYPPFFIDRKSAKAAAFSNVFVPVSSTNICDLYLKLPDNRLESLETPYFKDDADKRITHCHGIRIDIIRSNQSLIKLKDYFLRVIAEHTLQWWINGTTNPFDHGFRLSSKLLENFQFPLLSAEVYIQYDGSSKVVSSWNPCLAYQKHFGFEQPINADTWNSIKKHIESSLDINVGIENFNSAISEYINYQDEKSILSLSVCFEILESKYRTFKQLKRIKDLKPLFDQSNLIQPNDRSVLRDLLLIDRGHVAHGNKPPRIINGDRTIEDYIEAMYGYLCSYMNAISK